ncbi:MAG: gliding motility-associated C-terminal domain-containing protein [Flavobacteriales bacterium]|nr:gliding motility-associated C-terminal domain-containing protein [Flavobacteriales bacterium]
MAQCITSVVSPSCPGKSDASITVIYTGDEETDKRYLLLQNNVALDSAFTKGTHSFTGLAAKVWETQVYLSNGTGGWNYSCARVDTVNDPDTLKLAMNATDINCKGDGTGSIVVTVEGGTPPFNYLWNSGRTTSTSTGLSAGTYAVVVTDVRGCVSNKAVTLKEPATQMSPGSTQKDVLCAGKKSGSIDLSVTGGSAPYTFQWSHGATTEDVTNLSGGTYTVSIYDGNQCEENLEIILNEPDPFLAPAKGVNISCNGLIDGTATVTGEGGTSPYSYLWSTGETTATITGLDAGRYIIIAVDANACPASGEAIVIEPTRLKVYNKSENLGCDRTEYKVEIVASGGTLPHSFQWSDGSTDQIIEEMIPGDYEITVTDGRGCSAVDTLSLEYKEATCVTAPSGFTPNGDGINDTWTVRNFEKFQGAVLQVFDLTGTMVFDSGSQTLPWGGTFEGADLEQGTYYYILDLNNGEPRQTGPITILR